MKKLFDWALGRVEKQAEGAGKYQKMWLYVLYGYIALSLFFCILFKQVIFLVFIVLAVILYFLYVQGNKRYKKMAEKTVKKYKS